MAQILRECRGRPKLLHMSSTEKAPQDKSGYYPGYVVLNGTMSAKVQGDDI